LYRKIIFIISITLISIPLFAGSTWEIKIQYPDKEVKTYNLGEAREQLTLGKIGWTCIADKAEFTVNEGVKSANRIIACRKGNVSFETFGQCIGDQSDATSIAYSIPRWFLLNDGKEYRSIKFSCKVF
jgi:hypothetical protein